eukprot:TRINITY_DN65930_c0_g1_i1.p1 TRINITY_DN65930_c0_g1~~TRINITY_DN65930_c0_g1_i1.p1  ORF type:complete len:258 (+),score=34.40 TRINITY_DN65930_c0_g1_i1:83-775(+)
MGEKYDVATLAARKEHLKPFTEALAAAEQAIRALAPCAENLNAVEAGLRALLTCATTMRENAESQSQAAPSPPYRGDETTVPGSPSGPGADALEEWYSDPWASTGGAASSKSSSSRAPGRSPPGKTQAATFHLNDRDDAQTEVIEYSSQRDIAPIEDVSDPIPDARPSESQWQYGRCVAIKLVVHSPKGSSAFEQLLPVLLTVFNLSDDERKGALTSRRKMLDAGSWWPF